MGKMMSKKSKGKAQGAKSQGSGKMKKSKDAPHKKKIKKSSAAATSRRVKAARRSQAHLKKKAAAEGGAVMSDGAPATGDAAMGVDLAVCQSDDWEAGGRFFHFLQKSNRGGKAEVAVLKAIRGKGKQTPEVMGAALNMCAAAGLVPATRLLIQARALLDMRDPASQKTPLQRAAAKAQVSCCSLLIEAGAEKAGAAESAETLTKHGPTFENERKQILAMLRR